MSRRAALRPEHAWLLIAACVLLLVLGWGVTTAVRAHIAAAEALDGVNPRVARLTGLLENEEQLRRAQADLTANLAQFVYPAERGADDIGNDALQRVRELATQRGLRVASSQATQPKEDKDTGLDRIDLSLAVEGDWASALGLLRDLSAVRPAVFTGVAGVSAQGAGTAGRPHVATFRLSLFVLRQRP